MNREALARFMMASCPMANRRLFVTESVIQVDGLDKAGKKVTHRMFAYPNGSITSMHVGDE
jgi:hypothetical protein